ncbi:hypothetical protein AKJ09_10845 [Labilithrix luteola]|uniref:Lipoprotein n=1 Tax=Labilithrix luteola TaxID=1391654 RepID=A0A0K1QET5_9BACT|nr:hypothetical protein [Labilithrix luteola]AKV04182.1 hypothetical protein AKJ09_10845 [Labilithrix luteola]
MNTVLTNVLRHTKVAAVLSMSILAGAAGCSSSSDSSSTITNGVDPNKPSTYVLGSVVIDADGNRTTYVQAVPSLESGPFNNKNALELGGNGLVMAYGDSIYVGLAEQPTWVRYSVDVSGKLTETGRLSFLNYGVSYIDFGNTIVDGETAVSLLTGPKIAVIWNPTTMTITGEVSLNSLTRDGYDLEVWTTISHNGLVYIPGRWADWTAGKIFPGVSMTVLDPKAKTIVGTAEDDRCASGGRVVFGKDGYGYVLGDGRNYSIQMYANAAGTTAKPNCLLRMPPGQVSFDKDYFFTIPSLTGGREAISELDTAEQGSGVGFVKMFYQDKLPAGMQPNDFKFWDEVAHKYWRLELGNPPTAKEVEGAPFGSLGFTPVALEGKFYTGESQDKGKTTDVYEIDPETDKATIKFKTDGYFYGIFKVQTTN